MEFPPINYSEKGWENLEKAISELGPDFFTTSTSDEPDEDLEEEIREKSSDKKTI